MPGSRQALALRLKPNPLRHPITDAKLLAWYERWKEDYDTRQAPFATCRFLEPLGNPFVHPEAERIVELHDSPRARETTCRWRRGRTTVLITLRRDSSSSQRKHDEYAT